VKITYFKDTDTLYIELRPNVAVETRDVDEDTLVDLDNTGSICGITIEHASDRTEIPAISYEQVLA
jgi:uncharacterized protein YuzE